MKGIKVTFKNDWNFYAQDMGLVIQNAAFSAINEMLKSNQIGLYFSDCGKHEVKMLFGDGKDDPEITFDILEEISWMLNPEKEQLAADSEHDIYDLLKIRECFSSLVREIDEVLHG